MTRNTLTAALFAVTALSPLAAAADTTCDRGAFRRDWTMLGVMNADPDSLACSVSFYDNWGRFQGTCMGLRATETPPTMYQSISGLLVLENDCHFTGSVTFGSNGGAMTVAVEGYASSAAGGLPQAAVAIGSIEVSPGVVWHLSFNMARRMWNSGVAIITPPPT
ncbi:hypothetical protein [Pararhodobacter sp.]|uniref:hypothetical protein n=1 Tax=Pararhodobacter sp. TaxID=2127056 RepID=UPI001D58207D|nr:hypothetical protein [Pararhodobacter sp.]MCB1344733.1 hypothetical protein [Paracoccaceae bacterium]